MRSEEEIRAELENIRRLWVDLLNYQGIVPMPNIGGTPEYWAERCNAKMQFGEWVLNDKGEK